jgi:hypothetical protein
MVMAGAVPVMLRWSSTLEFDTRRSNQLAPFLVFSGEEFSELAGRTRKDDFTPIGNGLLDFGIGETSIDRLVERIDDRCWRIPWGDDAQLAERFITWYEIADGRNIRQRWCARRAGYRKRTQFARFDVFHRLRDVREVDLHLLAQQGGDRRRPTPIGHVQHVRARHAPEQFPGGVRCRTDARRCHCYGVGIGSRRGDQFRNRPR